MNLRKNIKLIIGIFLYIFENEDRKLFIPFRLIFVIFWQLWKRTISLPIVVRLGNGKKYYCDPVAENSTGAVYVSTYERKYINFLRKNLYLKSSNFIDVGSNSGLFAMWFSDIFTNGYLFEPTPDLFNILQINIQINNLEKYKSYNLACSDKKQELQLVITGRLSGNNRIKDKEFLKKNETLMKVNSISIDDLELTNGFDFLKIDTEGSELLILKGAENTLKKSSHAIALVENNYFKEIFDFFNEIGWKICDVDSQGKLIVEKDLIKNAYNLICVGPDHPLFKIF